MSEKGVRVSGRKGDHQCVTGGMCGDCEDVPWSITLCEGLQDKGTDTVEAGD